MQRHSWYERLLYPPVFPLDVLSLVRVQAFKTHNFNLSHTQTTKPTFTRKAFEPKMTTRASSSDQDSQAEGDFCIQSSLPFRHSPNVIQDMFPIRIFAEHAPVHFVDSLGFSRLLHVDFTASCPFSEHLSPISHEGSISSRPALPNRPSPSQGGTRLQVSMQSSHSMKKHINFSRNSGDSSANKGGVWLSELISEISVCPSYFQSFFAACTYFECWSICN